MRKVMDGPIGDEILKAFEAHDLVGLAFYDSGARSFYNTKKHDQLDRRPGKGMKFRVIQSDVFVDMVNALGANATPMAYGEVYSALETGVIDGAENNWPSYESAKHYEVAKHYTLDQHQIVPEVLVMAKPSWDKLTPEDQAIVKQAAKDSVVKMRELWDAQEKKSRDIVEKAGVKVSEIDKQPLIDAMKPGLRKVPVDAGAQGPRRAHPGRPSKPSWRGGVRRRRHILSGTEGRKDGNDGNARTGALRLQASARVLSALCDGALYLAGIGLVAHDRIRRLPGVLPLRAQRVAELDRSQRHHADELVHLPRRRGRRARELPYGLRRAALRPAAGQQSACCA